MGNSACLSLIITLSAIIQASNMAFSLALGTLHPVFFPSLSHPPSYLLLSSLIKAFYLFHAQGQVSGAHLAPAFSHFA